MPRYKCEVEYVGTNFSGWQKQNDAKTIQGDLTIAIKKFSDCDVDIFTSGRTDAGVHAISQTFHFDMQKDYPEYRVMDAINYYTKKNDIAILSVEKVSDDFHARFSAKKRYYKYIIINRRAPIMIMQNRAWHIPVKLDVEAMKKAGKYLVGTHDFSSFRDSQCCANSPIKTVDEVRIESIDDEIIIYVSAKSFLHHMVRNIVGTLKLVGEGKKQPDDVSYILEQKDRTKAGMTAPACGLYFIKAQY